MYSEHKAIESSGAARNSNMKTFFIFLRQDSAQIFDGIKTKRDERGIFIPLPEIKGLPPEKLKVRLDRDNLPIVQNCKVGEMFFRIMGGRKFREASHVLASKPTQDLGRVAVFTSKRWPDLSFEIIEGKPNGEIPGVQIMNKGDIIHFFHAGKKYHLINSDGELLLTNISAKKSNSKKKKPASAKSMTHKPFEVLSQLKITG